MAGDISLKQLRYLVALADARNFRRAAESVGVTQPSLSAQIADLEDHLKLQLVERKGRPLAMTPAGRDIVAVARKIVDEVTDLKDLADDLRRGSIGQLRMGSSLTIGPYFLPWVLHRLHASAPALQVYTREDQPDQLTHQLERATHDAILTHLPLTSGDVQTMPLFREPFMLVTPKNHRLAQNGAVALSDLAGQKLLSLGPNYPLREQVSVVCKTYGASLLEHYEGTSLDGLRLMVAQEMGVAIMPALYVASEITGRDPSVVAVPFRGGTLHRTIGLAWRKSSGRMRAIDTLMQSIRDTVDAKFGDVLIRL